MTRLQDLENKSVYIFRELKCRFHNPVLLFSAGKDSTAMLYLARKAYYGKIPFPIIHIDTGYKFQEIYDFRDKLVKEWDLDLEVIRNEEALEAGCSRATGREDCCHRLKTLALKNALEKGKYDAVIVGIRRDEHGIRNKEHYFSPRDKEFKWNYAKESKGGDSGLESLQDPEFFGWDIFATDYEGASHVRVHPLLHWTEQDIWDYTQKENIPINPLYLSKKGKRYRSIGCECCTTPIKSKAKTVSAIVEELASVGGSERDGRDKDKEAIMEKLRSLGYM